LRRAIFLPLRSFCITPIQTRRDIFSSFATISDPQKPVHGSLTDAKASRRVPGACPTGEIEAILNSRPLTTVSGDPSDVEPLTPAHILTMKPAILPPPGTFQDADVYSRMRWRRIQYLAQVFWSRWRKEFLFLCQARSKWTDEQRNLSEDDIVLIKEDAPRSQWPLGRVLEVESGQDGLVRAAKIKTCNGSFRRPIAKLVRLLSSAQGWEECRSKAREVA
jgi:hypothetical protein